MSGTEKASRRTSSKAKAVSLLRAALSKKALDPVLIRLKGLTSITDYFLVLSGSSTRHVTAIAEAVVESARKQRIDRLSSEGVHQGNWALLDYGDVIVHVFREPVREFYDLEGLWSEAPLEKLPDDLIREIEAEAEPEAVEDDM
jgi:ribosome-associated protein